MFRFPNPRLPAADWEVGAVELDPAPTAAASCLSWATAAGGVSEHHFGPERQESAEEKAERLVRTALREAGLKEQMLPELPKAAPAKMAVARRLRAETTV